MLIATKSVYSDFDGYYIWDPEYAAERRNNTSEINISLNFSFAFSA